MTAVEAGTRMFTEVHSCDNPKVDATDQVRERVDLILGFEPKAMVTAVQGCIW